MTLDNINLKQTEREIKKMGHAALELYLALGESAELVVKQLDLKLSGDEFDEFVAESTIKFFGIQSLLSGLEYAKRHPRRATEIIRTLTLDGQVVKTPFVEAMNNIARYKRGRGNH